MRIQDRLRGFFCGSGVRQVIAFVAVILAVGSGVAWTLWGWLRSGGMESNSETLRTVSIVLGAAVALVFALWRSMVSERQSKAAQRQADTAQRSLTRKRFQKGVEMIGSPVLAVRLGGIYALDHLAQEHPSEHHVQVMRVLCAFVRNPFHARGAPQPDIQDAVKAIGGRKDRIHIEKASGYAPDLSHANLLGLKMGWLDFSGCNFEGADLSGAALIGSILRDAHLYKATLQGATLDGADLAKANMTSANLSKIRSAVSANFTEAPLRSANLSYANMQGANFQHAVLEGADLTGTVFIDGGGLEASGLTQKQVARAAADPNHPPIIEGLPDAETGQRNGWSTRPKRIT